MGFLVTVPHRETCPLFPHWEWGFHPFPPLAVPCSFTVSSGICLQVLPLLSAQERGGTGYKYHYCCYIQNNIIPEWSWSTEIYSEHQCQQQEPLTSMNFNSSFHSKSQAFKSKKDCQGVHLHQDFLLGLGTIRLMGWAVDSKSLWWGLCCSNNVFQL